MRETLPLQKIKAVYDFWNEVTLPEEERYKRMRKEADKAAQKFYEDLFSGKVKPNIENVEKVAGKGQPEENVLERFLDLGLAPEMLNSIK